MAFQPINRGAQPNDNTGDNLREGARKVNANFDEIYKALGTNGTTIVFDYKNYKLDEVSDVTVPLPSHEYVLSWDTITSKWIAVEKLSGNVVGHMIPTSNNMYDLGDANNNFRDVYVAGNTFFNPGEQRLFSDMGTLKVQYDYQTSNAVLFDSNTSTAASVTVLNPSQDIVFTDTTKLDSVTFGGTTIHYFPGIDTSIGPPYGLMPNVIAELTLEDTGAGTSNTYTNYDYTAYSTPAAGHNDAFYFSGRQTLTVENGQAAAGDGKIQADLLYADKATLVIKRISSDGIGEVVISNKTQTLLNKTIPAANNTILMSITNLIDVNANTANIMSGDILQWSNTANAFTAMSPSLHPIAGPVSGSLIPTANAVYDLGSPTSRFNDLWLTGNTLHLGSVTLSASNEGLQLNAPIAKSSVPTDVAIWEETRLVDSNWDTNDTYYLRLANTLTGKGAWSNNVIRTPYSATVGLLEPFNDVNTGTISLPFLTNDPATVSSYIDAGLNFKATFYDASDNLLKTYNLINYSEITVDDDANNVFTINNNIEGIVLSENRTWYIVGDLATVQSDLTALNGVGGKVVLQITKNKITTPADSESSQVIANKIIGNFDPNEDISYTNPTNNYTNVTRVASHLIPMQVGFNLGSSLQNFNGVYANLLVDPFGDSKYAEALTKSVYVAHGINTPGSATSMPTSPTSPGITGEMYIDSTHVYICKADGDWVRIAIDTGW